MNIDKEREVLLKKYLTGDGFISVYDIPHIVRDLAALDEQKARPSDEEIKVLAATFQLHDTAFCAVGPGQIVSFARALLSKYAAPAPKGEPSGYPCKIIEADFDAGTVLLQMESRFTASAGPKFLCDAAPVNDQDAKDAQLLDWMVDQEAQVQIFRSAPEGCMYRVGWPDFGEVQSQWFSTPREAIRAAIAQQGKEG